ncbi:MAG: penicillin-binding protein 1A [Pelagibacterales bacterium]|nr:penicillin-binding protein 1A [Pelagibacterales bacterium]
MIFSVKNSIKFVISLFVIILLLALSSLMYFSNGLPDYQKLSKYQPPVSSRIYSENGTLINEYALEKRIFIPYEAIPSKIIDSFLSAEDKNFFQHPGIDAKGIFRAVINNIENVMNNKRLEGASTITQQVAKNFLLTNEVSFKRKIKEAILAFRIEKAYSKKRILELYLNQIYLGQGTYGVAAASLEYFDKSVKDLSYSEAALLAALPKAPSKYNPFRYPEEAKFRRNLVLRNLSENGYLKKLDYERFKNSELILKKRNIKFLNEANSYSEEVRRIVKENYGFDKLYAEGFSINVPLDTNYQIYALESLREGIESYDKRHGWRGPITNKFLDVEWEKKVSNYKIDPTLKWKIAEITSLKENSAVFKIINTNLFNSIELQNIKWVKKKEISNIFKLGDIVFVKKNKNEKWQLKQYPEINGSIVVLDPFTGKVKALVGGFSFKSSEFNRATQAKRQPGSAFKPIVYAAALENQYSPNTIVLDAPFIAEQGIGLKNWKPENYGKKFYGPSTLRKGIEYSRNLMTVRVAQNVGLEKILKLSKDLNIYDDIPELLSVSLGSAETTLLKITNAYATFVNGGKKISPILINRIQDRRGKTIFNSEKRKCLGCDRLDKDSKEIPTIQNQTKQIISEETAYQITSMLEGAVSRGTGKKLRDLKVPLAGKTGTTNNNYDAWFIGYSSNLVIGVYVGYDKPQSLGKYETGSKAALPIFKNFIKKALYKDDFKPFQIPKNIFFSSIDYDTGERTNFNNPDSITEAFKLKDLKKMEKNNLNLYGKYDKLEKFRQFY